MKVFFMNKTNKQYSAAMFAVMVAFAPAAYAIDNHNELGIEQASTSPESVVWYKKESTQKIASGLVIAAVVGYVIAVRMNKVSSPFALVTALFCSQVAKGSVAEKSVNETKENKNTEDKPSVKPQDHHNKQTPSEPAHPKQPEHKQPEHVKTETTSFKTEEHHTHSKIDKQPVVQENQQTVHVDQTLQTGLTNPVKNFVGQEGIEVPQILKNFWNAATQPRSDDDLKYVL
jgi:hypothetical protein